MKKFFKYLGVLVLTSMVLGLGFYLVYNEALPTGVQNEKAEALAQKMLNALDYEAFKTTEVLEWSFRGEHHYLWKKNEGIVEVSWNDIKVILHTNAPERSEVYVSGKLTDAPQHIETATAYFNNDSFWLVAPYKILDQGTERSIVNYEGKEALLVTYTSGGTTPGDSYLWILDENGMPTSYKMWVGIIPLGGVSATWNDWTLSASGMYLPTKHTLSLFGMELSLGEVKAYNPKADALANNILKALHNEAYINTRFIEWSFRGSRFFIWDKQNDYVEVQWGTTKVGLYTKDATKNSVLEKATNETASDEDLINRAIRTFNNDSFWLIAPYKLFEPGIYRRIVIEEGKEALHVKYTTGGSTPGDSYTWIVDENYIPIRYKMYVPSMKMKGLEATWEGWKAMSTGALLPQTHFIGTTELNMGDIKGYN